MLEVGSITTRISQQRRGAGMLAYIGIAAWWMWFVEARPVMARENVEPITTVEPGGEPAEYRLSFFESQIRPALVEHCLDCHSIETEASGGLLLDSREGWETGGDLGPAVEVGSAEKSLLIRAIEYGDPNLQMPPDGKLDETTIAAFRTWIDTGAVDPRKLPGLAQRRQVGLPVDRALEHWAYRPLLRAEHARTSTVSSKSPRYGSAIDVMIGERLAGAGLVAEGAAGKLQLIRRLTFDLSGLPPSPDEIQAFFSDESPLAYQHLVDRLLASPHYAEHFARHWMDVARYAESITLRGFVLDEAWRYRDYLIAAFAEDRPFDEMIRDQIAGDLLPQADLRQQQLSATATAFLAMGNNNLEDQDKMKLEFDYVDEQLETIGRAFLAQTIGCARCHDHKFDPIPTRDYYALAAIMRSTVALEHANLSKWLQRPLPLDSDSEDHFALTTRELERVKSEIKNLKSFERRLAGKRQAKTPVESLAGIVIDDTQARFVGEWELSTVIGGYVAEGYRHDLGTRRGDKTATFDLRGLGTNTGFDAGVYEVRMSYTPGPNRASNVPVQVFSANEAKTVIVNQRQPPPEDGLWVSLGEYPFEKDGQAFVLVSNDQADGTVIVDAVQFVPIQSRRTARNVPNKFASQELQRITTELAELAVEQKRLEAELAQRPRYLTIVEGEVQHELAIRIRGNVHSLGESVPRGFLTAIAPAIEIAAQIGSGGSGRIELANWIADQRNPLTARVYSNRVWYWLMGEGLVATENNFGTTGEPPSHPELLDWLASELIASGWSTKHLVRTIVTSETYRRRVSKRDAMDDQVDPTNRLYRFANVKRIPIEAMRDAMLCVSGELDRQMGGSSLRPGTSSDYNYRHDSRRRSIYSPVLRNSLPPLFQVFDFPDSSVSAGQRSRSTVATQSLAMMNHPWVIQRAQETAARLTQVYSSQETGTVVEQLYQECFGRPPVSDELDLCVTFLTSLDDSGHPTHAVSGTSLATDQRLRERVALLVQSLFASVDFRFLE